MRFFDIPNRPQAGIQSRRAMVFRESCIAIGTLAQRSNLACQQGYAKKGIKVVGEGSHNEGERLHSDRAALPINLTRRSLSTLLMVALISYFGSGFACSESDVSKVKKKVADAAAILNTAAHSNRTLYQTGSYGVTGSPEAIQKRQMVATVVHQANEYLSMAVERAANLTASDLEVGKTDIVALLQKAVSALNTLNIQNENIRLIIASAVAAINSAVTLTLAIRGT